MISKKLTELQILLFILIICSGITGGCRSKKALVAEEERQQEQQELPVTCYPIEIFSVPSCRLEISGSGIQSVSLSGNIFVIPDSVFFFRGRLLIDVLRGAIYNNSFVVINYLERTVYRGSNDFLQNIVGFPVNPKTLLMLLTDDECGSRFINPNSSRHPFRVDYDTYRPFGEFELPTLLNISAGDGSNNFRVRADFRQIVLNVPEQFQISIPANYRVVVLE